MAGSAFLGYFLSGVFLVNGVPHFVKGVTGQRHMTPFARSSSAPVNVAWGATNFALGYALLRRTAVHAAAGEPTPRALAVGLGGLVTAVGLAAFWSDPNAKLPWHD